MTRVIEVHAGCVSWTTELRVPSFVVGLTASDDAVWATIADRAALARIDL